MDIFYNRKKLVTINDYLELEVFFKQNNFFKLFKKIPNEFILEINEKIQKTDKLNFKECKKWYRGVLNYPESCLKEDFLLKMGWDILEVKKFISEKQRKNSYEFSKIKKLNPENFYSSNPKRIDYWIKKGYNQKEAVKIISESQKTFSKEICIKKFGEEKGLKVFQERQKKWITTLTSNPNLSEIRKKQNSYKYELNNVENLINRTSFLVDTKNNIIECINNDNIEDFVKCILNKIDVKTFSDLLPYFNSKIIINHYNTDIKNIKTIFFKYVSDKLQFGYYGQTVYHNNIRFKSVKEYKLCLLFEEHNIEYIYEKRYPLSQFVSDFYLPKFDLYIEYFGLLDGKNIENLEEIQKKYYGKMLDKITFCELNKINLIYDTNFNNLYKKIITLL